MATLIICLIIISLFEATWLNFSIVLLIIIVRSFISPHKSNYILAFVFGLFISILTNHTLGVMSLIFLLLVKLIHMIRESQFASYWLFILPLSIIALIIYYSLQLIIYKIGINLTSLLIQGLLILPIYLITRFWEDRFVPQKDVRLKIKN